MRLRWVMSVATLFMGLPWFYLGMTVVVTSFIPIVGAALIWVPVTVYLLLQGQWVAAGFMVFVGAVVMGFVVDNLIRPQVLRLLSRMHPSVQNNELRAVNHLLISTLSIAGGILAMGIYGLIFGPLIVALAVTVIEMNEEHFGAELDRE